jgi:hypothetical protein
MRTRRAALAVIAVLFLTTAVSARVISYAPYSDRASFPGVQNRLNRHFVVFEQTTPTTYLASGPAGQVVLYDSQGIEEPRVIYPASGVASVGLLAMREEPGLPAQILINATVTGNVGWFLSTDSGATWKKIAGLPSSYVYSYSGQADFGGPIARGRGSIIRIGTRETPFIVAASTASAALYNITAVNTDGSTKVLALASSTFGTNVMVGTDQQGRRILYRSQDILSMADVVTGAVAFVGAFTATGSMEGWITADGAAIVELVGTSYSDDTLWYLKNGTASFIAGTTQKQSPGTVVSPPLPYYSTPQFFAVPTADYNGAWFINRGTGQPTTLSLYTPQAGVKVQWSDVSGPEVEALHPSAKGDKVLIQVHRPRQTVDALLFKDPALAVWHVGDPAPRFYDELFLSETTAKGFVHLDVDAVESGAPFVFDSGAPQSPSPLIISPAPSAGGGSDVMQEWGVVRASLAQKLVLPGVGRTPGAYGSFWMTDVTFYNSAAEPVGITVEYRPTGEVQTADVKQRRLILAAHEILTITDSLKGLFGYDSGVGAYFITPDPGTAITATSRTYTTGEKGTYGYGMNAIDVFAAASARFPVTFSGAFLGNDFRTNAFVTDVSGRGSEAMFSAIGPLSSSSNTFAASAPIFGVRQVNGVGGTLGVAAASTGALKVQPSSGEAIASVFAVDNRTNDPTFFPPDLSISVVRVIPGIAHVDGANNSHYRTDLYLLNTADTVRSLNIQLRMWDGSGPTNLNYTLLPHESRVIPDVLLTAFNKTGIGRLRIWTFGDISDTSVRVTSRTYTVDEKGGTYGFLMPPLNSFQEASPGESLEIIGPALDKRFRTNLGLVDIAAFPSTQAVARVEIFDDFGKQLDKFDVTLPAGGGTQVQDLFHARSLPESGVPVLIRVTSVSGMIGAYAATNDNGTNDPTYVAANLASKQ